MKNSRINKLVVALVVTVLAAIQGASFAAVISWGSAQNITAATDVVTNGVTISAFQVGNGLPAATVNGVTFLTDTNAVAYGNNSGGYNSFAHGGQFVLGNATLTPSGGQGNLYSGYNTSGQSSGSGSAPFISLSSGYQSILSWDYYNFNPGAELVLTFDSLTVGHQYLVQLWSNDSRGYSSRSNTVDGVTTLLFASGGDGTLGQFATGTFTANATTQVITLTGVGGASVVQLNAFQLRDLTIPEPSTMFLMLCGGGLLLRARRFFTRSSKS